MRRAAEVGSGGGRARKGWPSCSVDLSAECGCVGGPTPTTEWMGVGLGRDLDLDLDLDWVWVWDWVWD